MRIASWMKRLLALFLSLCTIVGLLPAVGFFALEADAAITDEISALVSELTAQYGDFKIPATKAKYVTGSTVGNLDGTYFLFIMARDKGSASQHRMINFDGWPASQYDRLSENCYDKKTGSNVMYWPSAWVSINNWQSGNDSFAYINDNTNPENLLDYAVEFQRYTGTIHYNTSQSFNEGTGEGAQGSGWEAYINWEYKRDNYATSGNSTYVGFGPYLKIATMPSKSDIAYSIKSLHPSHAAAPYLGTTDSYGAVGYLSGAAPFFMKVNADTKTFKIYKVDQNGGNFYTYWLGIDNYYSNKPINAHTISQIVREDKNQNTGDYPGNYDNQYTMDWELIQVSPYTLELYKALYKAKAYVKGGQGSYPAETYLGFLQYVKTAMADYKASYQTFNDDKNNSERTRMDSEAKDLTSYMALLDIEKTPESYLDISMEVLDFRADSLLFESPDGSSAYTLSAGAPAVNSIPRPGTNGTGTNGGSYVAGLIEPYLKNGQIVYTQDTINYIANALYTKHVTSYTASNFDSKWNNVFADWANVGPRVLGSWDDTKTRVQGGENGGILPYTSVTTCYDLAYYMLTNLWRETSASDIIDETYHVPYNTKISELTTMRLLKGTDGRFYFRSDLENGRNLDNGTIFNYPSGNAVGDKEPNLNAAADLGFEKILGNNTTGANESATHLYGRKNYHVMYHVRSAFVYYESKNLSFDFTGDDDVYFFINGKLVRDIGGMHAATSRSLVLNEGTAKDLGLVDGDICTFDMYLIDRHTTGVNLNLTTNIEMMPVDVVPEKIQYEYTGAATVGDEIREGSVVTDGTEVGYGFKFLNRSKHGVSDLIFKDDQLKVTLSGSSEMFSLGGSANVSELILVYRAYEPLTETFCTKSAESINYDELYPVLKEAVGDFSTEIPMAGCVYTLTGLNESQLQNLLKLGLPANMQLSIYGFHRTVYASTGSYSNKVVTTCTPLLGRNADDTYVCGDPVNGFAVRNLNVQSLDSVTAQPMQVVLDYDKPIEFTVEEILKTLNYNPLDAKVAFMGIRETDVHGTVSLHTPAWLHLVSDGETFTTTNGTYVRDHHAIRYTPNAMIESVDRLYALIRVTDNYLGRDWFLTVEIRVLPANIVYYEAENLEKQGLLTVEEKTTDGQNVVIRNEFGLKTDSEAKESADRYFDPTDRQDMLYFGFGNTTQDNNRYMNNPIYGETNMDSMGNWSYPTYMVVSSQSSGNGYLTYTARNPNGTWNQINTGSGETVFPLSYIPSDDDWVEVRMKIDGATANNGTDFIFCLEFLPDVANTTMRTRPSIGIPASNIGSGFFTLRFPLNATGGWPGTITYAQLGIVRRINLTFEGLTTNCTATFTYDYFYVGPEEDCPSNYGMDYLSVGEKEVQDPGTYIAAPAESKGVIPEVNAYSANFDDRALYFSFDNTTADQGKYTDGQNYGTTNFDLDQNWRYNDTRSSKAYMDHTAGTMYYTVTDKGEPWFETVQNYTDDGAGPLVLKYSPKDAEILEVRVKFNNLYAANSNTAMQFFYGDGSPNANGVAEAHLYSEDVVSIPDLELTANNTWFIYQIVLSSDFRNTSNVASVRLAFPNIKGRNNNGTITFDYIYIGPKANAPSQMTPDYLYFDFDNSASAQYKYNSSVYGGTNFDLTGNWRWGYSATPDISGGVMTYNFTGNSSAFPWFETQRGGYSNGCALRLDATKAEVLQVRMKFNNIQTAGTVNLKPLFGSGTNDEADQYYDHVLEIPASEISTNNKWFTYTIPLGDKLKSLGQIKCLRLYFERVTTGTVSVDYIYLGPALEAPTAYFSGGEQTYGYDSSYTLDSVYSDNESLYVEGKGTPKMNSDSSYNYEGTEKYTEINFSFTGTGFDLISRTGKQQATLRVSVYTAPGNDEANRVKTLTVNNKGELELYQIPVVSMQGLAYDTYYVSIWVNDKVTVSGLPQLPGVDLSSLTRGNEFYLDAIRIYEPIDVSGSTLTADEEIALYTYKGHKEAYQFVKEIRNILLSADAYGVLNGTLPGAVFLDVNSRTVNAGTGNVSGTPSTNYTTASVVTYNKVGPKNEVYLAPGQSVVFRLEVDTAQPLGSLDIGAKTLGLGDTAQLAVGYVTSVNGNNFTVDSSKNLQVTLHSATAQYYATDISKISTLKSGSSDMVYLVIYNQSPDSGTSNIISITDVKVAYADRPDKEITGDSSSDPEIHEKKTTEAEPVRFLVDNYAGEAAVAFVDALWETPMDDDTPEVDIPTTEPIPGNVVVDINIRHSLDLASDISINYAVAKAELDGYEDVTMICTIPVYSGDNLVGTREMVLTPTLKGQYYYFTLTGLTAVHMNDLVEAGLTMTKDGITYASATDVYSVARYAYGQLSKTGISSDLRKLCAELLRYGGSAQIYKGYRTDCLADEAMTEEELELLTDMDAVSFDSYNTVTGNVLDSGVSWAGKSLLLDSKVAIRYILNLSNYTGEIGDLTLVLTYESLDGEEKTVTLENPVLYNEKLGYYSLDFDGLLAAELRQPIRATVYCGEKAVTGTLEYSASTYGKGKTGELGDLCKCLMSYSDSARAFFAK